VRDDLNGEPRITLLQTVRTYARDRLSEAGQLQAIRDRHARHYGSVAVRLSPLLSSERYLAVRAQLEAEHENIREALRWALPSDRHEQGRDTRGDLGLLLCAAVGEFWLRSGYFTEGRNWIQRAVDRSDSRDRPELARCLSHLSRLSVVSGDFGTAREFASASVEMWRRMDDEAELQAAVNRLAFVELNSGRPETARELYRDVLTRARRSGDAAQLRTVLLHLALLESHEQHHERSLELQTEALEIALSVAEPSWIVVHRQNIACSLRQLGRVDEANAQMLSVIPTALQLGEPILLLVLAEDLAAVVADLGDARMAARLLGAAEAMRERLSAPREPAQQSEVGPPIDRARHSLSADAWAKAYSLGRATSLSEALAFAVSEGSAAQKAGARPIP
jgi:tetratricopeptide (TPR) repeat protein